MSIEKNLKSFRLQSYQMKVNDSNSKGHKCILSFDEAYQKIIDQNLFKDKLSADIENRLQEKDKAKTVIKNKEYFRKLKSDYSIKISEVVTKENITVRGYNDMTKFIADVVDEIIGFSSIKQLMYDPTVTDIYCLKWNKIYYESSQYQTPQKFEGSFKSEKHYKDFIERLLRESGKGALDNGENKIIDFDLYGDRYNALSQAVSPDSLTLTIRKHREDEITLDDIIKSNCINQEKADEIGMLILGECNLIVAGITGSGKTTTLRAFLDYYVQKANKRMLVCEDTRELFPKNDHTLELVTSKGGTNDKNDITLRDLIILALRQKPKYIVVGEVRGVEAESAIEAMETGHSTLFSMHSGNAIQAINRLVTKYLMQMPSLSSDIVERIICTAIDYIMVQDDIPGIGRKITSLTEISYSYEKKTPVFKTIFKYNFKTNQLEDVNKLGKEKAEKMLRKGITYEELDKYVEW